MNVALYGWRNEAKGADNPILLYKSQWPYKPTTDCQYLDNNYFVLINILKAPLQCAMIKEFGNKIICVGWTYKTTRYNFQLTTQMIVDEYSKDYPVSWCLSNRQNQILQTHYFKHLKKRPDNISKVVYVLLLCMILH